MRMRVVIRSLSATLLCCGIYCAVFADQDFITPVPHTDNTMVSELMYSGDKRIKITLSFNHFTRIVFPDPTESISEILMGRSADDIKVLPGSGVITMKPIKGAEKSLSDRKNVQTMISTNKNRVYRISLSYLIPKESVDNKDPWYEEIRIKKSGVIVHGMTSEASDAGVSITRSDVPDMSDISKYDFRFTISDFKNAISDSILKVFRSETITYLELRKASIIPAVYGVDRMNHRSLVNTRVRDMPNSNKIIIIHGLHRKLELVDGGNHACIFYRPNMKIRDLQN